MVTKEEKIVLGETVHNRPHGESVRAMAKRMGVTDSTLYEALREYRKANGIAPSRQAEAVRQRKRKPEAQAVVASNIEEVERYKSLIVDQQHEISRLQEEAVTMQKIIMVLGEKL